MVRELKQRPRRKDRKFVRMTLAEAQDLVQGKSARQIWMDIETYGDGFVIPKEYWAMLGNVDGTVRKDYNFELIDEVATAADANWQPTVATSIYEVWGIHATGKMAAVVADRVLSIKILPGYHGQLASLPTSYITGITGPTLSTGQQGGIWVSGSGGYAYVNDNGTVTRDAAVHNINFPIYLYGSGALIGCANSNDQAGDLNGISAIVRRVA